MVVPSKPKRTPDGAKKHQEGKVVQHGSKTIPCIADDVVVSSLLLLLLSFPLLLLPLVFRGLLCCCVFALLLCLFVCVPSPLSSSPSS